MKRPTEKKSAKGKDAKAASRDLEVRKGDKAKGGGKMVVNTYRVDPYKGAKFH